MDGKDWHSEDQKVNDEQKKKPGNLVRESVGEERAFRHPGGGVISYSLINGFRHWLAQVFL